MNMVDVFEKLVVNPMEQKLLQSLDKLKSDKCLQQEFRKLAVILSRLDRIEVILNDIFTSKYPKDSDKKWMAKKEEVCAKRDEIYSIIEEKGFERWWINIIVNSEKATFKEIVDATREKAVMEIFGQVDTKDIDIFDTRWDQVGQQIRQAKDNYIEGK